jgi:hypothetical protein
MDTERDELSELQSDVSATADSVAADAARLATIEAAKAALPLDDPELAVLADEAERLTLNMARKAKVEAALIHEAQSRA